MERDEKTESETTRPVVKRAGRPENQAWAIAFSQQRRGRVRGIEFFTTCPEGVTRL